MHKILHTKHKRKIAYKYYKGKSKIGFLFFPGFNSNMMGTKALKLYEWCKKNNYECTIFDYSGHGKSSEKFIDTSLKEWIEDSIEVLNNITHNPQILVGSSMGGWIAIKVGLANPNKIKGIVTIAAAPDFTDTLWKNGLNKKQKREIIKNGFTKIPSEYEDEGYIITKKNIAAGNKNLIFKSKKIKLSHPIKLIHGKNDEAVCWKESLKIFNRIISQNAELILIKNGDHRLSNKQQLKKIIYIIHSLFNEVSK